MSQDAYKWLHLKNELRPKIAKQLQQAHFLHSLKIKTVTLVP